MLNKRSQTQKAKYCMSHLYEMSRLGKFLETEGKSVVSRGWDTLDLGSMRFLWGLIKCSEISDNGCTTLCIYYQLLNCIL